MKQRPRIEVQSSQFKLPADDQPEPAATGFFDLQRPTTLCQSTLKQYEAYLEVVVDLG